MRDRARCEVPLARAAAALAALALAPASASLAQDWTGHAVIVGISDYPGTANDLDWCDDDAREVYNTLLSDGAHWSADNVRLLVNGAAGYAAMQTAV
ncbi:MAG: caspase family protein, partial [Planctomycetota bacterium]